jgi:hypothetical protein
VNQQYRYVQYISLDLFVNQQLVPHMLTVNFVVLKILHFVGDFSVIRSELPNKKAFRFSTGTMSFLSVI